MTVNYLFGPVTNEYADQNLREPRAAGLCRAFGNGDVDLTIGPTDTWTEISAKFPAGWKPEFLALWLAYAQVPTGMWDAPIPIVGLAADWNLLWHQYRRILPRCDLVLTDAPRAEALRKSGLAHVRAANLYGLENAYLDETAESAERDIDILFVGNLHLAVQSERLPWLARIAQLGRRWNVQRPSHRSAASACKKPAKAFQERRRSVPRVRRRVAENYRQGMNLSRAEKREPMSDSWFL